MTFAIFLSSGTKKTVFSFFCSVSGNENEFDLLPIPAFFTNHRYKSGLQRNRIAKNCLPSAKYGEENKRAPNSNYNKNILNLRHA
jgi:hypothetical protein